MVTITTMPTLQEHCVMKSDTTINKLGVLHTALL